MGASILFGGVTLRLASAGQFHLHVDDASVRRQDLGIDASDAAHHVVRLEVDLVFRIGFQRQTDPGGIATTDRVPGEQHALRPLRPAVVEPQVGRWRPVGPRRREPDLGIIGRKHDVARKGKIGAAGKAITLDFGDDRLVQIEHHCGQILLPGQVPDIIVERARSRTIRRRIVGVGGVLGAAIGVCQVVAGAKVFSRSGQENDVHVDPVVGL